jgi:radical SAM protein with 4Fe4S-binding SPASM domain
MKTYNIDVNLTQKCTFGCEYCFEECGSDKRTSDFYDPTLLKKFIFKLLDSPWFKKNYDTLNIGLWGGEPTIKSAWVIDLIENFMFDDVKFGLFTNGYKIDYELRKILTDVKSFRVHGQPKVMTQISYDGMPIHDLYRRSKGNALTSTAVRDQILKFDRDRIPVVIKSVVTPQSFKYMYSAYKDIKALYKQCRNTLLNYFPTIDYYGTNKLTHDELETAKKELNDVLIKIASEEIHIEGDQFFFRWFNNQRNLCTAGHGMVAVDVDGHIYTCHACLYDDQQKKFKHRISNIELETVVDDLERMNKEFAVNLYDEGECKNCDVNFCLRCNHAKYDQSKKQGYLDRWRDYQDQPNLCEFYKINSIVVKSIKEHRNRRN